ncbi:SusE domain-containing protein [Oceanihabitans sp. 2_MG-2023]|uniref:SusE domain-containing protein n=1 Tax=Oceanihabitans sp. 2_MG-2023 TaxID=3062661 RepID=UPI0026E47BC7|nr:SusE domain-containing protein [Oceanihabitans sp. 2_MG-2023]MDO6595437.1 SusE domain-containing protein [Oceanihabitans sp. 2_MG-2023]
MKNIIYKSILSLFITTLFVSCDDNELTELNSNGIPEISLSDNTVILTEANADQDALTITWTEPDYGFDAAPEAYKILIDTVDGDFTSPQSATASMSLKTFTAQQLNTLLTDLELPPNEESQVQIKVEVVLSSINSIFSEAVNLTVTPYPALSDISSPWGIVGSATPNSWDGPDVPFYKTENDNVFAAYVYLLDGEIKFRENNDWAVNYGDTGVDGTLEGGGDNIAVTAGTYYITMNLNTLTYTMTDASSEDIWGLVGSSTPNGWDGTDWPLYPAGNDIYITYVTLLDGELKFRLNNDWGVNYGDTGVDGTLDSGGDNIVVTAGSYKITMDLFNQTYTIELN